jgi:hypothetical protein
MMQINSLLYEWIREDEKPSTLAHNYLNKISKKLDLDAFIASNISRNYYFSDGYVGTAIKLQTFLVLLKTYQKNHGIDLNFINNNGSIMLSPETSIINTKASLYPWYLRKQANDSALNTDLIRYDSSINSSLDLTQSDISDIGWQLISVQNAEEEKEQSKRSSR